MGRKQWTGRQMTRYSHEEAWVINQTRQCKAVMTRWANMMCMEQGGQCRSKLGRVNGGQGLPRCRHQDKRWPQCYVRGANATLWVGVVGTKTEKNQEKMAAQRWDGLEDQMDQTTQLRKSNASFYHQCQDGVSSRKGGVRDWFGELGCLHMNAGLTTTEQLIRVCSRSHYQ